MKNISLKFLAFVLLCCSIGARANTEMQQFMYEFHALESQQALVAKPFTYSDLKHGVALKKMLEPSRIKQLFDLQKVSENKLNFESLPTVYQPVASRYEAAFHRDSKAYEFEYLDMLDVMMYVMQSRIEQQFFCKLG